MDEQSDHNEMKNQNVHKDETSGNKKGTSAEQVQDPSATDLNCYTSPAKD